MSHLPAAAFATIPGNAGLPSRLSSAPRLAGGESSRADGPADIVDRVTTGDRNAPLLLPAPEANQPTPSPAPSLQPSASEPGRDWQFIVVKVDGHGLAAEIRDGLMDLDREGTSSAAFITVRAEQGGKVTDYSVGEGAPGSPGGHLHLDPAGADHVKSGALPMLGESSLHDFLVRSMTQYPSRHVMLVLEGHSQMMRTHLDEIRGALESTTRDTHRKLDILAFDACFLAQAETASEFRDTARILVGSQEGMEGFRPVEKASAALASASMEPHDLARWLVAQSTEYTLSAVDLEKFAPVEAGVARLVEALDSVSDPKLLAEMRHEIEGAQHFYTQGVRRPSPFRGGVDLVDALERISGNASLRAGAPQLVAAATSLADLIAVRPDGVVFAENHIQGVSRGGLDLFDTRRAHGLSIHAPVAPPPFRDSYLSFGHRRFDHETGWTQAIAHLTSDRSLKYLASCGGEWVAGGSLALAAAGVSTVKEKVHR